MTLTPDQVPWGAASMLLRQHGERAASVAAARVEELERVGNAGDVAMWKKIASCLTKLSPPDCLS